MNKVTGNVSRRDFLQKSSLASLGLLWAGRSPGGIQLLDIFDHKPNSKFFGVQIGVITYSFRSMPGSAAQILQYCLDCNISAIELMGDPAEEFAGKPPSPVKMGPWVGGKPPQLTEDQKTQLAAYQKQVAEWRAHVSMDKFKELRKMYRKAGVAIYAFKPTAVGPSNTDVEVEYALRAAKALGARSVTIELPTDPAQSKRLGDFAAKHKMYIGYHAHTQATDTAWDLALSQSPYYPMNFDRGPYLAAGPNNTKETLLALIAAKPDRITSMHLKDRQTKENGAGNLVWGQGNTPIKEILTLLKEKRYKIPVSIELEYEIPAGSNAVQETKKCRDYAKKMLGA